MEFLHIFGSFQWGSISVGGMDINWQFINNMQRLTKLFDVVSGH